MEQQLEVILKGAEFKRLVDNQFSAIKEKYGLRKVEIEVLFFLSVNKEENTPTDIYRYLKLNKGHISQALDALIKKNYICCVLDKNDRRKMHYVITEKAQDTIDEIVLIRCEMEKRIFNNITDEEIEYFARVIKKINDNIEEMLV